MKIQSLTRLGTDFESEKGEKMKEEKMSKTVLSKHHKLRKKSHYTPAFNMETYRPTSLATLNVLRYFLEHQKKSITAENLAFNILLPPNVVQETCQSLVSQHIITNLEQRGEVEYEFDPKKVTQEVKEKLDQFYKSFQEKPIGLIKEIRGE